MRLSDTTRREDGPSSGFGGRPSVTGVLVAFAPPGSVEGDRFEVGRSFTVGRSANSDLLIRDDKVSRRHFRIRRDGEHHWIEDLDSANGTFVQGRRLHGNRPLNSPCVVRAGDAVLVFQTHARGITEQVACPSPAIAGHFSRGPLVRALREATESTRHVLLLGPTGTGKELAARVLCTLINGSADPLSLVAHNCARFSSPEEATTTLFGVGPRVFSGVDARAGLIESAQGGVLFLDEVHNLPQRVQRSLLRVIEDGRFERIGENLTRDAGDVRFILASNAPGPSFGLAPDLLARLRAVALPPLKERVADIPEIFCHLLTKALSAAGRSADQLLPLLGGDHFEAMCLDGFARDNIRGISDLADRLVTRVNTGIDAAETIATVFEERFPDNPVSERFLSPDTESEKEKRPHYERNRDQIIEMFGECEGNLSAVERRLRARGIVCSRRWLAIYLERWGVRPR